MRVYVCSYMGAKKLQLLFRGFRMKKIARHTVAATHAASILQEFYRRETVCAVARKVLRDKREARRRRLAATDIQRVFRGHWWGRRLYRQQVFVQRDGPQYADDWPKFLEYAKDEARKDEHLKCRFKRARGIFEEYAVLGTRDVFVYKNTMTSVCSVIKPSEWAAADRLAANRLVQTHDMCVYSRLLLRTGWASRHWDWHIYTSLVGAAVERR